MDNYNKIINMTIMQMAENRIQTFQRYAGARIEYHGDFEGSEDTKKEALKAELKWLRAEAK
jgi:hypothetical protein